MAGEYVKTLAEYEQLPLLSGDVKLEEGENIRLTYDAAHNSIVITNLLAADPWVVMSGVPKDLPIVATYTLEVA